MLSTEKKSEVMTQFGRGEKDTGSPEVQVALLTTRITELTTHFSKHIHDHHSKRGLMKLIGRRRRLLRYLQKNNKESYTQLIQKLGLRK